MALFAQALALLPAVTALVVILITLADRRDGAFLNDIRELHLDDAAVSSDEEELESTAA